MLAGVKIGTMTELVEARRIIMVKPEEKKTETPPPEQPSQCLLCGQAGSTLLDGHWICDHCKNVVQAEWLARKRKIEKEGGGPA